MRDDPAVDPAAQVLAGPRAIGASGAHVDVDHRQLPVDDVADRARLHERTRLARVDPSVARATFANAR